MSRAHTRHVGPLLLSLLFAPALLTDCTTVDPLAGATIADLTSAEAQQWCSTTYASRWSAPAQHDWPVQPSGLLVIGSGGGITAENDPGQVAFEGSSLCLMELPVDQCVENLRARPCQATLQELDDCLQAFSDDPPSIDARCAGFHAAPSCSATIVTATLATAASRQTCELPVK